MDQENYNFAKDNSYLKSFTCWDTHKSIQQYFKLDNRTALIETGQGFDLGLNHGYIWPYVTGRDCMIGRWLDSAGVHPRQLGSPGKLSPCKLPFQEKLSPILLVL